MDNRDRILIEDAVKVADSVDLGGLCSCKILIAGAGGLIGTHIVYSIRQYVEHSGAELEMYLLTRGGLPPWLDFTKECRWIKVFRGDMTDSSFLRSLPEADIIIDAAGYGQPLRFMKEAVDTLKINTYALFELMNKLKPSGKFLFLSSSAVYTGVNAVPFCEEVIGNANTSHPRSCYIEGKKCGEAICNAYRLAGIDAKSVRLSIVYGPGTKREDVRVLNAFIRSALVEGEIKLMDDGSAEKAFLYVSDAVSLIWKILLWGREPVYNIGSGERITVASLAQIVAGCCNVPVILGKAGAGAAKGAIQAELLSMERVEREFGRRDYIGIREGVCRTIDWARQNLYL